METHSEQVVADNALSFSVPRLMSREKRVASHDAMFPLAYKIKIEKEKAQKQAKNRAAGVASTLNALSRCWPP